MATEKYQSCGIILDTASKLTRANFTDNAPKYKILLLNSFLNHQNGGKLNFYTLSAFGSHRFKNISLITSDITPSNKETLKSA